MTAPARIRVDLAGPEPEADDWIDAARVRLKVKPLTGVLLLAIEAAWTAELAAWRGAKSVLDRLGYPKSAFGVLGDEKAEEGAAGFLATVARGRALITEWEVTDGDAAALVNAENVARLFNANPDVMRSFIAHTDQPARRRREVGKLSASSPSTSLATEANTAHGASAPLPPAAEDSPERPDAIAPESTSPPPNQTRSRRGKPAKGRASGS